MRLVAWALALGVMTSTHAFGEEPPLTPADPWAEDPPAPPPPAPPPAAEPAVEPPPVEPPPTTEPAVPADAPAAASDDMIDPSELPLEGELPSSYPRPFVERPLLLPRGLSEFSVGMGVGRESVGDVRLQYLTGHLSGRRAFERFELSLGGNVVLLHENNIPEGYDEPEIPLFQRVFVALQWRLPADISIGLQGVVGNLLSDYQRYSPSLFVRGKIRTSKRGAIYFSGGGDYNYQNEENYGEGYVSHRFAVFASGTAILQATSDVALQVGGSAALYRYVDPIDTSYRALSASVSLLISAGERVDVSPYVTIGQVAELETFGGGVTVTKR
jgi:hypothetical protein